MTFYESQRWHSGEKRGFRLNVRRVAAAAAFASAEHFQRENALPGKLCTADLFHLELRFVYGAAHATENV
ncbi:hypothetical protein [Desulfovibrio sp. ZJ369]|uniref:hypothetical protein n=1 Tax=Desulfovibrio sp. ZJ369 TaxID=2709793 RepID=UPI001981311B|nr:hypothetical protein [Desulfovibrio sp. ZJ369]